MVDISDHNCLCGMRLARLPTWVTGERPTGKRDAHVRPHERSEVDDAGRASMEVQAVHQANHKAGAAVESAGRRSARSGRGGFPGPSVSRQCLCAGGTDRLGQCAGRSHLPADLSPSGHVARAGVRRDTRPAVGGRVRSRDTAARACHSHAHEPASGRPDDAQRAATGRGAAGRGAAQVQRNGAVLSQRRADLPCLARSASAGRSSWAWKS